MKRSRLSRSAGMKRRQRTKVVRPTEKKLWTEWDTYEIAKNDAKFRMETQAEELKSGELDPLDVKTEEEMLQRAFEDSDLYSEEWDVMSDSITELMKKVNKTDFWVAEVENFGWRRSSGTTGVFKAVDGKALLQRVLPDTECTFKIFKVGNKIMIQNWHHDSPTGDEWYTIRPATRREIYEGES